MKVFINPGHAPNGQPDPGACNENTGLRESDVAANVSNLVAEYLSAAGIEVCGVLQSDSLSEVCTASDDEHADIFVSIHCNAASNEAAMGTETWYYGYSNVGATLADCVQRQIVNSVGTNDRGIKGAFPGKNGLYVLTNTNAIAVLVELAFISNVEDEQLLRNNQDNFARAIARGVTDYQSGLR